MNDASGWLPQCSSLMPPYVRHPRPAESVGLRSEFCEMALVTQDSLPVGTPPVVDVSSANLPLPD